MIDFCDGNFELWDCNLQFYICILQFQRWCVGFEIYVWGDVTINSWNVRFEAADCFEFWDFWFDLYNVICDILYFNNGFYIGDFTCANSTCIVSGWSLKFEVPHLREDTHGRPRANQMARMVRPHWCKPSFIRFCDPWVGMGWIGLNLTPSWVILGLCKF